MKAHQTTLLALLLVQGCRSATTDADPKAHTGGPQATASFDAAAFVGSEGHYVASMPSVDGWLDATPTGVGFVTDPQDDAFRMRTRSWGRRDVQQALPEAGPRRVEASRSLGEHTLLERGDITFSRGAVLEWWRGLHNGAQQGFVVRQPPPGSGHLELVLEVSGARHVGPSGITDSRGQLWSVSGVFAWDADGDPLPAHWHALHGDLVISVDDTEADYPIEIDPVYSEAAVTRGLGYYVGRQVLGLDDVDGDGHPDFAVVNGEEEGDAVWIILGDGTLSPDPSQVIPASSTSTMWSSMASAGDPTGSGYSGLLLLDAAATLSHFPGSSDGIDTANASTVDTSVLAMDGHGDIDGDGYDDLLIGTAGSAYVHLGSSTGWEVSPSTTLSDTDTNFGQNVAHIGDVDGDGYGDVFVANYTWRYGYVYYGSATGLGTSGYTAVGPSTGLSYYEFGTQAGPAGDIDGDGYDDLILGNNSDDAWIYLGSSTGITTTASTSYTGSATRVVGIGDVNADGYDDLGVGDDSHGSSTGRVAVYHGSSSGMVSAIYASLTGSSGYYRKFHQTTRVGDLDGDGYDDFLGGGYQSYNYGGVVATAGGSSSTVSTTLTELGGFGVLQGTADAITHVGDLNGDGYDDFAVGDKNNAYHYGGFTVTYGKSGTPSGMADIEVFGTSAPLYLGGAFAEGGVDFDADGYDDLVVVACELGSYWADPAEGVVTAYVYGGSVSGIGSTHDEYIYVGTYSNGDCAWAAVGLGDMDGDGYEEFAIATEGDVEIYEGDSRFNATLIQTLSGHSSTNAADPHDALAVGDFDGDGELDLAIGNSNANLISTTDVGGAFIHYGTSSGLDSTIGLTIPGEGRTNYFGSTLAAGDYNGDGYDDLVVGAEGKERVYVYAGAATGVGTIPDQYFSGEAVAAAGDVDTDGYDDLIVDGVIYSGSSSWIDTSTSIGPGTAGVGDIDGDGFADVVHQESASVGISIHLGYDSDDDGDGYLSTEDCDDTDASIHPGAVDDCDGVDTDCDGVVDSDAPTWYTDADGDGYGDSGTGTQACTQPSATADNDSDCNDSSVSVSPDAAEQCDGVDNDCDGTIDEGDAADATTWYADADGDGYGNADSPTTACFAPTGYLTTGTDCDDSDASINPAGTETCNGADDDCDGTVDENDATDAVVWYQDLDGDGAGTNAALSMACDQPSGYAADSDDCDDSNASIHPDASESCDEVDNDCDGSVDEGVMSTFYEDTDGDGYGVGTSTTEACDTPSGFSATSGDCDDTSASVSPTASEQCNSVDDNCDGTTDEGVQTTYFLDADGDGYGVDASTLGACSLPSGYAEVGGDCDDTDTATSPAAAESCNDEDDDCNGIIDDGLPTSTVYRDADGDGYGHPTMTREDCGVPSGYVSVAGDCNDALSSVTDGLSWYQDLDGDGFGNALETAWECVAPSGYVADDTDCDDGDASVFPGAEESVGDDVDSDCDGEEICRVDADDDGFVADASAVLTSSDADCDDSGEARADTPTGDCDDSSPTVHPGAEEIAGDHLDSDCDGLEDCFVDADGDGFRSAGEETIETPNLECDGPGEADADLQGGDCNDDSVAVGPSAPEVVGDGVDQNCNGTETCYADLDGDGFRPGDSPEVASEDLDCDDPSEAWAGTPAGDCDDSNPAVHPAGEETAGDGIDQDCDGADLPPTATGSDGDIATDRDKDGGGCNTQGRSPRGPAAMVVGLVLLAGGRRREQQPV